MASTGTRGSERAMAAWKASILTEASVKEIGAALDESLAPRIVINGIPFPDLVRMELDFGSVEEHVPTFIDDVAGEPAAVGLRG